MTPQRKKRKKGNIFRLLNLIRSPHGWTSRTSLTFASFLIGFIGVSAVGVPTVFGPNQARCAQPPSPDRQTDDAATDAVDRLLQMQRFDDAIWLCKQLRDNGPPEGRDSARWTARLSEVLTEQAAIEILRVNPSVLMTRLEPAIEAACAPVDQLLSAYPEAQSASFLQAARLSCRQRLLRSAILAASVSPLSPAMTDQLLQRIARLQQDTARLQDQVAGTLAVLRSGENAGGTLVDDVVRLSQELALQRISLAILQTELFPEGSDDYRTAAAEAALLAEKTLPQLPTETLSRQTAQRWWADARLRSGNSQAAEQIIQEHRRSNVWDAETPRWDALEVRRRLADDQVADAKRLVDTYFTGAGSGGGAARSTEMDFARLRVLLAEGADSRRISSWLDQIERRGGPFARRRAETIALARMRRDSDAADPIARNSNPGNAMSGVAPGLIAAQGEDWLRRGEPLRAAALLKQAALAETTPDKSIEMATKSAAAAVAGQEFSAAVDVLRQVAQKHAQESAAPQLMLQAAVLVSKSPEASKNPAAGLEQLEELLTELSQRWPASESAVRGNRWLGDLLVAAGRREDAATAALQQLLLANDPAQLDRVAGLWYDWLSDLETAQATEPLDTLSNALEEIAESNPEFRSAVDRLSVWMFDRGRLSIEPGLTIDQDATASGPPFRLLADLRASEAAGDIGEQVERLRDVVLDDGSAIAPEWLQRFSWRLFRDAALQPTLRSQLGPLLAAWPQLTEWQRAQAKLWEGVDADSIGRVKEIALDGKDPRESLRKAIALLGNSDSQAALEAALELSDRLAAGVKMGTTDWHQAKLQSIGMLRRLGRDEEARKRAAYILLTRPPEDDALKQRYRDR
ncbi:hypothetical protein FYK55_26375 [Roseiconus nitratireducens]|uniref:Uncharacterized protein n=1 Tax=Roseiconus nitratireducens TaxID=2605748 RepID=A0A5M6D125_9BACT|nr:hypothetical protein [Roseiconus nitratireducens]KAA5538815.1 hypothetical protein FYK55_26375 [Roseiconus nitratireducens]